jgi:predicted dehydrogenase
LGEGKSASPTFREALRTEDVTDAVLESAAEKKWVKVRERI